MVRTPPSAQIFLNGREGCGICGICCQAKELRGTPANYVVFAASETGAFNVRYGITPGPMSAEADALVALPKFMKKKPIERVINAQRRLKSHYIYDSSGRQIGIVIDVHISHPPTPGDTVSAALIWRGRPIRRIDWKAREVFADGAIVEGWHEHLWDDTHQGRVGREFEPPVCGGDHLESMFICACQHWNITVLSRQDRPLRVVNQDD